MRECPWCGRQNLNVYAYCQSCGRGFDGPENKDATPKKRFSLGQFWPFGGDKAA
jgi:uncharacterized membrane protein YvbJ